MGAWFIFCLGGRGFGVPQPRPPNKPLHVLDDRYLLSDARLLVEDTQFNLDCRDDDFQRHVGGSEGPKRRSGAKADGRVGGVPLRVAAVVVIVVPNAGPAVIHHRPRIGWAADRKRLEEDWVVAEP